MDEPATHFGAAPTVRRPVQQRSRLRLAALIDATDALLVDREPSQVGIYDIAAAAGVPPASAYHLLPTREAAFLALAERYLQGLWTAIVAPAEPGLTPTWQAFVALEMNRTVAYYNAHPVMGKLFFGENALATVRMLDRRQVEAASASAYERLNRYFVMPYLRDPETRFAALIGLYDGVWMTSYARHGRITEAFAAESLAAGIAYCETFLPAVLARRQT